MFSADADVFIRRRDATVLFFGLLFAVTIGSIVLTRYDVAKGLVSFAKAFFWGASNFYPTSASFRRLPDILVKLWETILMSISATVVASVPSLFLALSGSRSTRLHPFFTVCARGIGSFFRNMPLVAWAMVL
ncbi:MAG TPA: phosphonate ABC transporter permease, partial [Spirochaetia bacterium]|nr:phosphonate ABC transporter permease [Spirochaetia bacterium]